MIKPPPLRPSSSFSSQILQVKCKTCLIWSTNSSASKLRGCAENSRHDVYLSSARKGQTQTHCTQECLLTIIWSVYVKFKTVASSGIDFSPLTKPAVFALLNSKRTSALVPMLSILSRPQAIRTSPLPPSPAFSEGSSCVRWKDR